ncbi:MAG TPA: peptidoglycan DD-metalloendopeptidase family protein [Candidatus Wallbacteria bacterium]|nr:peptidoglycan DD-metalloendopeptidase family protein [Candidatus Wallbacteria bacterium]
MINKKLSNYFYVVYVIVLVYAVYLFGVPIINPVTAKPNETSSIEKQFENSMLVFPGELVKAEKIFNNTNISKSPIHEKSDVTGSFANDNIVIAQLISQAPSDLITITSQTVLPESEIETEIANDSSANTIQELKLSSLINIGRDAENIFGRETDKTQLLNSNNKLAFSSLQKNFYGATTIRENEIANSKLYLSIDEKDEGLPAENLNYAMLTISDNPAATESDTALDMTDIEQSQTTLPTNNILQNINLKDINIAALTDKNTDASKAGETREFNKTHIVTQTDTLFSIAKTYNVSVSEIMSANQLHSVGVKAGSSLSVPSANNKKLEISKIASAKDDTLSQPTPDRRFLWPSTSRRITSKYGTRVHPVYHVKKFHNGLDIGAPYGSRIKAAENGVVVYSGWKSYYGRVVIIKHSRDLYTLYAHCSALSVKRGQSIKRGDAIAKVGSSGLSTGPHLHFSVQKSGRFVNPLLNL